MIRSPSSDAPHDGSSTAGMPRRAGVGERRAPKFRVPEILRLLRLFAFAIVTIVCAGIASPGRGLASVAGPADVAAPDVESAAWWALEPQPAQQWRHGAPPVDRDVVEAEVADDDTDDDDADGEARSDVAAASVVVRGGAAPRKPARALSGVPSSDTSHFAIADGFPRGPPV